MITASAIIIIFTVGFTGSAVFADIAVTGCAAGCRADSFFSGAVAVVLDQGVINAGNGLTIRITAIIINAETANAVIIRNLTGIAVW